MGEDQNRPAAAGGPGMSFEAEERAMRKGRGRMVLGMITAAVLAIGLIAFFAWPEGGKEYREFGGEIARQDAAGFKVFWSCALQGTRLEDLRNNEQLATQLHSRGQQYRGRWATKVRDTCMRRLDGLQDALTAVTPPEGQAQNVTAMRAAVETLRGGWSDYLGYILGIPQGESYSEETASAPVTAIARGWHAYVQSRNAIVATNRRRR